MRRMACNILGPFLIGCRRFGTLIVFLLTGKQPYEGEAFEEHGYKDVRDFGLGQTGLLQPSFVPVISESVVVQTGRRSRVSDRHVRF